MIAAIYPRKSTEQQGISDDQKSVARQPVTHRAHPLWLRSSRYDVSTGRTVGVRALLAVPSAVWLSPRLAVIQCAPLHRRAELKYKRHLFDIRPAVRLRELAGNPV